MASSGNKKNDTAVEEVEMFDSKLTTIPTEHLRSDSEDESAGTPLQRAQTSMSKTKWLACIALCICYTTAFQQHMCTSSIVKHIDAALGKSLISIWDAHIFVLTILSKALLLTTTG
jgi:nicotinamide riboside transporter PnuC